MEYVWKPIQKLGDSFKICCCKSHRFITLVGKVNHQITFERKERLKNAFSEVYETICQQDHPNSKQLLGDDLDNNVKKNKGYKFYEPVHYK